jgi:FkbM family methyltransferase
MSAMTLVVPLRYETGKRHPKEGFREPAKGGAPWLGWVRRQARTAIARWLRHQGYVLRDAMDPPRGFWASMELLKRRGFEPRTVIDVGVGYGTQWLYESFPHARFELFEPLDVFRPSLNDICDRLNARYRLVALGRERGEGAIEVYADVPTSSTMAGRSAAHSVVKDRDGATPRVLRKFVPIHPLDEFAPFDEPILLKLDAEGFESEILEGAHETLERTQVVVSEISVGRRHKRDVPIGQFLAMMEKRGFYLVDLPEITAIAKDSPLAYVDAVFVRSDSGLTR